MDDFGFGALLAEEGDLSLKVCLLAGGGDAAVGDVFSWVSWRTVGAGAGVFLAAKNASCSLRVMIRGIVGREGASAV